MACLVMRSPSASPRRLVAIGLSTGDGDGAVVAGVPPWRGSSESALFVLGLVNSKFDIGCQPDPEPMPRQRGRPARYGSMGGRDKIPGESAPAITGLAARQRRRSEPCGLRRRRRRHRRRRRPRRVRYESDSPAQFISLTVSRTVGV